MKKSASFALLMIALGTTALIPVKAQDDLVYVAVDPCRIVDTREAGGVITANNFRNFLVSGTLGELAVQGGKTNCLDPKAGTEPVAISAYVVAVPATGSTAGVLTAYPSDRLPPPVGTGSTVNFAAGQVIGNTTNITLCDQTSCPTDGEFAVLARSTNQHVVVDVQGHFYPQEVAASSALHVVDGTANTIGPMVEWDEKVLLLTDTGYFTRVRVVDDFGFTGTAKAGDVVTIAPRYELPGCVGQPYHDQGFEYAIGQGYVLAAYDTTGSRYLVMAKGVTPVTLEAQSISTQDGCLDFSGSLGIKYPIVPNDPNVTGLSVLSFPTPITLQQ